MRMSMLITMGLRHINTNRDIVVTQMQPPYGRGINGYIWQGGGFWAWMNKNNNKAGSGCASYRGRQQGSRVVIRHAHVGILVLVAAAAHAWWSYDRARGIEGKDSRPAVVHDLAHLMPTWKRR